MGSKCFSTRSRRAFSAFTAFFGTSWAAVSIFLNCSAVKGKRRNWAKAAAAAEAAPQAPPPLFPSARSWLNMSQSAYIPSEPDLSSYATLGYLDADAHVQYWTDAIAKHCFNQRVTSRVQHFDDRSCVINSIISLFCKSWRCFCHSLLKTSHGNTCIQVPGTTTMLNFHYHGCYSLVSLQITFNQVRYTVYIRRWQQRSL